MEINILIEEDMDINIDHDMLRQAAEKVLIEENAPQNAEISLLITNQDRIQELNREYRGKDQPTDVLSFSMSSGQSGERDDDFIVPPDGLKHLGEIIISYPQAELQAKESKHSIQREMAALIVHGALHILGYDHEIEEKAPAMQAKELKILSELKEIIP
jgi:probable rRNA maturation factor